MDAEYLKANVGDVLANGLTAVVLNQPEDSVDYLARWLLKYVDNTKAEEELKLQLAKQAEIDKKADEESEATRLKAEKEASEAAKSTAQRKKDLEEFLSTATTFDGLYSGFVQHLKDITDCTGCYMGLKEKGVIPAEPVQQEEGDEGDAPAASDLSLQYIAASDDHKFLIGQRLKGSQGITFDVFKDQAPGGAGEGGGDEGDEGDAPEKKAEEEDTGPNTIITPNVLMGDGSKGIHFWKLPQLGSYMTMRLSYDACLTETTLDEAIEKEAQLLEQKAAEEEAAASAAAAAGGDEGDAPTEEAAGDEGDEKKAEGEEKKEEEPEKEETEEEKAAREAAEAEAKAAAEELYLINHLPKTSLDYAICLDTLGKSRRFSDEEVAYVKGMVSMLNEAVLRIDRTLFKEERARRANLVEYNESVEEKSEDERTQELERLKGTMERAGTGSPTTDADVAFKYRQNTVMALREKYVEFRNFNVFRGPLAILQALFFMLDYDKVSVSDLDGKPDWNKMRAKLDEEFFNKLTTYEPRQPQLRNQATQHATVANLRKMVSVFNAETVTKTNQPLAELLGYIRDALAVKAQARQERKEAKAAAEAEARALAEQQAAEAAAAAEAEAAAAEGGEGGEGGEEKAAEEKPAE
mmetsp:Transcript_30134/g.42025  ORF Transcript_30134/g.42025 Transcript_30134/m.42025 type:complete len:637 (-) Transcript_30134:241-2151(-)